MAKVDIVVPIYNVEEYLDKNIKSLINQTYQDIRIICVNDGSTDNSASIIEKYIKEDCRVELYSKENGGLSDARNYGLKKVNSEYVMFIDSDDFCEPEMVETALDEAEKTEADMVVFGYNQYYSKTNTKEQISLNVADGVMNLENNPELIAYTPNCAWNKLYKTSLFVENGILYPKGFRYEDLGTTSKLILLSEKIAYINKPLYNYLIDRPNNITQQVDEKLYHVLKMCNEIITFYKERNSFEKYYNELNYLVERNLINALRKVVNLKNKKFVFKFIDDTFKFKNDVFKIKNSKYDVQLENGDSIYLNKLSLKFYYIYKHLLSK